MSFLLLRTRGFLNEIPPGVQAYIVAYALRRIKPDKPNWVVFYPSGGVEEHLEDEGRTLITSMKA
jgi:hypothetical protein